MKSSPTFCDGLRRRDMLRIGAASLFGMPLTIGQLLAAESSPSAARDRGVSVILVFLKGGLSTIDTFDMKPHAPAEIRGEFQPISTCLPGVPVCEHLPLTAGQLDKFSLIRSFTHVNSNHGQADHYMLTG